MNMARKRHNVLAAYSTTAHLALIVGVPCSISTAAAGGTRMRLHLQTANARKGQAQEQNATMTG